MQIVYPSKEGYDGANGNLVVSGITVIIYKLHLESIRLQMIANECKANSQNKDHAKKVS